MEVQAIDHIHFNTNNIERDTRLIEDLIGKKLPFKADHTDLHGLRVAFHPFPLGFELMEATNKDKEMGRMYAEAPEGIFAISLKVVDLEKATAEMESMGYKLVNRYDSGPIKEALFDTRKAFMLYIELIEYPGENALDLVEEAFEGLDSYNISYSIEKTD